MNISKRVSSMGESAIHEMTRLSGRYDDVAFLSWAKPMSGTPEHIDQAVTKAIKSGKCGGYSQSEGLVELRQEIVKKLKRDNDISADISEIIVTIGAVEGLAAAVMAVIDPGDEIILPDPTYSTHIRQVELASGRPVLIPLLVKSGYRLDLEKIENAINSRTRAIMYCSPSNPTGTVFCENELRKLAKIAVEHKLSIITDEAYEYFVFDNNKHFSIASIPGMKDHAISVFTLTKSYAMTGWRIGYLHAAKNMAEQIKKAHIPFAICAPVVSQYAGIAALKGSQDCIKEFRSHYLKARNLMCQRLDNLEDHFSYVRPEGSYLMFPRLLSQEYLDSLSFCRKLLEKERVSTTPGVAFGPSGEGHIRLSFCVDDDMINKAFDRMERFFKA